MSNSEHTEADSTGSGEDRSSSLLSNTRCTFCFPCCFGSPRFAWWERVRATPSWSDSNSQLPQPPTGERWWSPGVSALMKLREWSELAAGPRWKTFIRRFNRTRSGGSRHAPGKYHYDPLSYALNFDEGDFENDDGFTPLRNFSTRYAAPKSVSPDSNQHVAVLA
ncbi:hypothetical protein Fmac_008815 [Flemingia macrophylla]|uniref:Uncharacterized protein n=1 Tax=Flemingia macrophylla TaxID=520843 RepID=A0ABD1MYG7_9FABA